MTDSTGGPAYRPSATIGTVAALAILFTGVAYAAVTLADGYGRSSYPTWDEFDAEVSGDAEAMLLLVVGLSAFVLLVTWLLGIVLFCVWLHRVATNARTLGIRNLEFTPGWAVGYFFIPFLNLFKPYQAVKEIWQSSDPEAEPDFWSNRSSSLVGYWWMFWLLGNVGGRVLDSAAKRTSDASIAMLLAAADAALLLTAAVLATLVIRGIVQRQHVKAQRAESAP
ncbi:MAG: DUF4328 domain-containing protein [bacterium]|nr:DUF4328 domain-containing protein [bacterium]